MRRARWGTTCTYATSGQEGFGGGGASDIRQGGSGLEHRVVIAGGGGGASATGASGGAGGGETGGEGVGNAGGGGQTSGGAGSGGGSDGSLGLGGIGGLTLASGGGGGGGGLFGGGGGSSDPAFGGGGGSGYGPPGAVLESGVQSGDGRVEITYGGDLAVTVSGGSGPVDPGDPVTYVVTVSNAGPADVPTATVLEVFPAALTGVSWTCQGSGGGTCAAAGTGDILDTVELPAGASVTYTVTATVAAGASGSIATTATVAHPGDIDPDPSNNTATAVTAVRVPVVPGPEAPAPSSGVGGDAAVAPPGDTGGGAAVCTSRRVFPLRLSAVYRSGRARVLSARLVRVDGRLVRRLRATRSAVTVDLRGAAKGTYVVRVQVRLRSGATRTLVRRYRTCQPRR